MLTASGPTSGGIALVVGMGIATYTAFLATLGYFASRFLRQQSSNHRDTLEALTLLRALKRKLPKHDRRIATLESMHEPAVYRRWHARARSPR